MELTHDDILAMLPHRAPFVFVDRVEGLVPGERAVGIHSVREDAFWVPGHFPNEAIMPGVLISEALAQVAGLVFVSNNKDHSGQSLYLVGMDKLRFRKPVRPGDVLELHVEVESQRRSVWWFKATAKVGGKKVADGVLMATAG